MRWALATYHPYLEEALEGAAACRRGDPRLEPLLALRARLEQAGHEVKTRRQAPWEQADGVLAVDLDMGLFEAVADLPARVRRVLLCMDSPIRVLWSHNLPHLLDKLWNAVLTWNRAFQAPHIHAYDIPFFMENPPPPVAPGPELEKGVHRSPRREATRGLADRRDRFVAELARRGRVDVYGAGWPWRPARGLCGPLANHAAPPKRYRYALVCEDALYSGYVTAHLARAVWAGLPAVYFGDAETAGRRFPGTFVRLPEMTVPAFERARDELEAQYTALTANVARCRTQAATWADSFLDVTTRVLAGCKTA